MLILIGIWGLAQNRFVAIWAPGIQPAELALLLPGMIVVCSSISVGCGCGLLLPRHALLLAMRLLLAFLPALAALVQGRGHRSGTQSDRILGKFLVKLRVVMSASWGSFAPPGWGPLQTGLLEIRSENSLPASSTAWR